MKTTSPINTSFTHEENQRLAYQLWEQANCPSGQDLDFWLTAERQLSAQSQAPQNRASSTPGNSRSNGTRANPKAAKRTKKAA